MQTPLTATKPSMHWVQKVLLEHDEQRRGHLLLKHCPSWRRYPRGQVRQVEVLVSWQVTQGAWHMLQMLFCPRKVLGKQVKHWVGSVVLQVRQFDDEAQGLQIVEDR